MSIPVITTAAGLLKTNGLLEQRTAVGSGTQRPTARINPSGSRGTTPDVMTSVSVALDT